MRDERCEMHGWECSISLDLKEIGRVDVDWSHLPQSLLAVQKGCSIMEFI
jgi:hypothetical protein